MLGGQVPFNDTSIPAILVKHLNESPRPLTELRPDLDPALEAIVLRCLEKQADKRYQSADELAQALAAAESGRGDSSVESRLPPIPPSPEETVQTSPTLDAKTTTEGGLATQPATQPTVRATRQVGSQVAQTPKTSRKGLAIFIGLVAILLCALGGLALWGLGTFFGDPPEKEEAAASPDLKEAAPRGTPAKAPPASPGETIDDAPMAAGGASADASQELATPSSASAAGSNTPASVEPPGGGGVTSCEPSRSGANRRATSSSGQSSRPPSL